MEIRPVRIRFSFLGIVGLKSREASARDRDLGWNETTMNPGDVRVDETKIAFGKSEGG